MRFRSDGKRREPFRGKEMAGGLGWKRTDVSGWVRSWVGWRGGSTMEVLGEHRSLGFQAKAVAFDSVHTGSCLCCKAGGDSKMVLRKVI